MVVNVTTMIPFSIFWHIFSIFFIPDPLSQEKTPEGTMLQ